MSESSYSRDVTIANRRGLHARASARFAKEAGVFKAQVFVSKDGNKVLATSIMGLMMLGAAKGGSINISAEGEQAEDAVKGLTALVENLFGEEE